MIRTLPRQAKAVASLGLLSAAVWAGTYATFSDTAVATSSFDAGTVDLVLDGDVDDAYGFSTLSIGNLKPGDVHYAKLPVANTGSLGFTYALGTAASGALAPELHLGIATVSSTCDATTYAAGTSVVASSTVLGSGVAFSSRSLAAATSEVLCFRVELPSTVGNSAQGATASAEMTFTATQLAGTTTVG